IVTASPSGGRPGAPTATTASCWGRPWPRWPTGDSSPSARRCTSTAATTTVSCAASSPTSASTTSCAPRCAHPAPPRPRSSYPSDCAGQSSGPTAGSRASVSSAATPTGSSSTDSPSSPSPSRCYSPPSSSTGGTAGPHHHAYPLGLLGGDAHVDRDDRARDVSGLVGGEEDDERRDFL